MRRLNLPNYVRRSGAKFESTERFLNNTVVVDTTEPELKHSGVPLTRVDGDVYATSTDELHCFVIGESGCGKTRRVILPTIQLMAKTGQSMVISDPKGELYRTTASSLRNKGYSVQVLNFRNPSRGHRWNPLQRIEKLYRSGSAEEKDKAVMALNDIISVLAEGKEGKDPYWISCASNVFRGIALIILEYGNEGELTFENISLLGREITKALSGRMGSGAKFNQFMDSLPIGSPIANNLSVIITNASDTRNSIISVFEEMVSLYTSQELLMDLFMRSEIDIDQLGISPTALFIILPDDNASLYPIATVLVKQIYSALVSLADEQPDGKLPNRVTFVLDEFANFAKMPSIESMLTAARSRLIRFIPVCQSMDQLTSKYGDSGRETLLSNCRTWIYMSCRNLPFLQRLEELIGYYISPYTNEKCPLIDIGDLQHFDMGQVLVLNDRCRPIIGYLEDYDKYDFGESVNKESVLMPEPQEPLARRRCNIEVIYTKAREINAPVIAEKHQEAEVERDGLRASIFGKLAERQVVDEEESSDEEFDIVDEEESSDEEFDISRIIAQIDAKIAELEAEEDKKVEFTIHEIDSEQKIRTIKVLREHTGMGLLDAKRAVENLPYVFRMNTIEQAEKAKDEFEREGAVVSYRTIETVEPEAQNVMELFSQGKYYEAAQQCIDELVRDPSSSKNNLAFLIRYAELDTSKLNAPFSLSVPDLLKDEFNEHACFAMINQALYEIKSKHHKKAVDVLLRMTDTDWEQILPFWYISLWGEKNKDPEGALVCMLAKIRGVTSSLITEEEYQEIENVAAEKYRVFIASKSFSSLRITDEQVSGDTEIIGDMPESITADDLLRLLDDGTDEDETDDSDGTVEAEAVEAEAEEADTSVEDLRAALQRKIQEKLNASRIDSEE